MRLNAANSLLFLHSVYHVQRDGCLVCPVIRRAAEVYSLGVEYRRSTRIYCLVFFERSVDFCLEKPHTCWYLAPTMGL